MVSVGYYRELYSVKTVWNDGTVETHLTTMPGFVHRIKDTLQNEGYEVTVIDQRTPAPEPDVMAAMKGLREYQYECAYVALKSGGGIIACPTGWGKTHIIGALVRGYSHDELCARNTPTIVVAAPSQDITRKNYEDLQHILPEREVGLVMANTRKWSDDVQVITFESLHVLDLETVGILIADEVHAASSSKRTDNILAARKALKWGMSATPDGRFDGRDLVTEGLFGPTVYQRTYGEGVRDGALVPIKVYWVKCPEPHIGLDNYFKYKSHRGKYRNGLEWNENRNNIIRDLLVRIPDTLQTLCIMPHLQQMNKLVALCDHVPYVHAETRKENLARQRHYNLAAVSRKERIKTYADMADGTIRKIFSTHVYKQGVNFPELQVIINAGGGGSDIVAKQLPGRESRNIDGKEESYLIDFWHEWDMYRDKDDKQKPGPIHRDDRARERAYTKLGFDQVWLDSIDELPFLEKTDG
jgi:superfamily II DNA or RNA helicase